MVGIIWIFFAFACVGIYPLWEGRKSMAHTFKAMFLDITGKKHLSTYHGRGGSITEGETAENSDGIETPSLTKDEIGYSEKSKEVHE